jgi:hypothetical protein
MATIGKSQKVLASWVTPWPKPVILEGKPSLGIFANNTEGDRYIFIWLQVESPAVSVSLTVANVKINLENNDENLRGWKSTQAAPQGL